jgi:hypothetical protein
MMFSSWWTKRGTQTSLKMYTRGTKYCIMCDAIAEKAAEITHILAAVNKLVYGYNTILIFIHLLLVRNIREVRQEHPRGSSGTSERFVRNIREVRQEHPRGSSGTSERLGRQCKICIL